MREANSHNGRAHNFDISDGRASVDRVDMRVERRDDKTAGMSSVVQHSCA